jgi:LuxR family maltose regulon positive regulatory protein
VELLRVPVVEAKLHPPALPKVILHRQRYDGLARLLTEGRLTTAIAPGGYGKTTFLASFAQGGLLAPTGERDGRPCAVAWYSLDDMDADPVIFLTHLIRTLSRAVPGFGASSQKALSGVPDVERQAGTVAAAVSEELWQTFAAEARDLVIVLDDGSATSRAPSTKFSKRSPAARAR